VRLAPARDVLLVRGVVPPRRLAPDAESYTVVSHPKPTKPEPNRTLAISSQVSGFRSESEILIADG
jgi:hypothetical protein